MNLSHQTPSFEKKHEIIIRCTRIKDALQALDCQLSPLLRELDSLSDLINSNPRHAIPIVHSLIQDTSTTDQLIERLKTKTFRIKQHIRDAPEVTVKVNVELT